MFGKIFEIDGENIEIVEKENGLVLFRPIEFDSSSIAIAEKILGGDGVIINLEGLSGNLKQRLIDFVSGCLYAAGGSIFKVDKNILLATPKEIPISKLIDD